ncbi:glycosyltransferase family protein [Thiohalobacter thiocyanaticus]|nr:hypothetical protein [Thiohalobacter thiocyanaticus]
MTVPSEEPGMEHCVFIQANDKQQLGALVAQYALRRNSKHNDRFDIRIMHYDDFPILREHEGQMYLRDGEWRRWVRDDLQSFTPTRFLPPQLMNYQGRSIVIDPDIFALADIWELFSRDMQGKAVMCRPKSGNKGKRGCLATSVMLMDNAKLTHWKFEEQFHAMFEGIRDYMPWVCLKYEDAETIGLFEPEWNDFDHLDENTRMLHNTKRKTQPWKTGLPVDFRAADSFRLFPPKHWFRRARRALFGDYGLAGRYRAHPDPNQEAFFFGLVRECLDQGVITEDLLREEMAKNHLRHDALELLDRTPPLARAGNL